MAMLTDDSYGNGFAIQTGDNTIDRDMGEQLRISPKELRAAINAENLTDRLFSRVLVNRSDAHEALRKLIPGAKDEK